MEKSTEEDLIQVGPGFWNIRGHFKLILGLIDIGTHMSIARLSTGKFLVIDTIPLTPKIKSEIDKLTENGSKIEAVLATHPFHTLAFPAFHEAYPNAKYYGTPRHIKKQPELKWAGDLDDCKIRSLWSPEIEMRIPDGSEFVAPTPENSNHFSCVFVFHAQSGTIHVDDTIMIGSNPGILLKIAGYKHGSMSFHPSIKSVGLKPTPEAPYQFRDWIQALIKDWNFDNIVSAHMGNKIGGAKKQLQETVENAEKLFARLSERNKKNNGTVTIDPSQPKLTVSGDECG